MIIFVLLATALIAGALMLVLPPLLRSRSGLAPRTTAAVNIDIHRDQLRELDGDLAAGAIDREQHAEARSELERRLLEDAGDVSPAAVTTPAVAYRTAAIMAFITPVLVIILYLTVGTPEGIAPHPSASASASGGITPHQVEQMIEKLATRLKVTPDDAEGWVMLGRSYAVLERFSEAATAYAEAAARMPGEAQVLVDYADVLAMTQDRRLSGEPEKLVRRALEIDPGNPKALAMAGTAAFGNQQYAAAVAHWQKLAATLPPDSEIRSAVQGSIAEAQKLAGSTAGAKPDKSPAPPPAASAKTPTVGGTVRLDDSLKKRAAPDDIVYIFARAKDGPPAPLAVLRKRVADLPFKFVLDDTMAMAPGMSLSRFSTVVVGARISKTGQATRQPGDLEGFSQAVAVGAADVAVLINGEVR